MNKYVGMCYDGEVSSPIEVETLIPEEIVLQIETALNGLNKNWDISSPIIDQQGLSVVFELIEKLTSGYGSKYEITIIKRHY